MNIITTIITEYFTDSQHCEVSQFFKHWPTELLHFNYPSLFGLRY